MINPGGRTVIGSRGPGDPERRSNRGEVFPHWVTEGSGADIERVSSASHSSPVTYSSTMTSDPLTGPSPLRDIIRPQFHQNNFVQELFIKNELGLKLDKGAQWRLPPSRLWLIGSLESPNRAHCCR